VRLILLNGPPAAGKSTVARRYVDDHPLTLNLDIDQIRAQIGGWRTRPDEAGRLARAIAVAAARTHLTAGHDVIVPQLLARPDFIGRLEELAAGVGAGFVEMVLMVPRAESLRRYAERIPDGPAGAGPDELSALYDRLVGLVASRPGALVIPAGDLDQAYRAVRGRVGAEPPGAARV
jgi:predicted kinase